MLEADKGMNPIFDNAMEKGYLGAMIRTELEIMIHFIRGEKKGKSLEEIYTDLCRLELMGLNPEEQAKEIVVYLSRYPQLSSKTLARRILRETEFMYVGVE